MTAKVQAPCRHQWVVYLAMAADLQAKYAGRYMVLCRHACGALGIAQGLPPGFREAQPGSYRLSAAALEEDAGSGTEVDEASCVPVVLDPDPPKLLDVDLARAHDEAIKVDAERQHRQTQEELADQKYEADRGEAIMEMQDAERAAPADGAWKGEDTF